MLDELKERVTQVLMRVEVVTEPPPLEAPPMEFLASHPAADSPYGGAEGGFDATGLMAADPQQPVLSSEPPPRARISASKPCASASATSGETHCTPKSWLRRARPCSLTST
mgnify:CR=1 FL=1